ncbi:MAG: glycosyltransferase family 39 protein [Deltaproteobacteria bacterium]|nr:glycosyltransferase family 39 protein [Deltaproteobacteria bacterium]
MTQTLSSRLRSTSPWIVAAIIVGWGFVLRLADLGTNPPGLWQDEASTGLDAYLIWTTGRDRAGALLPIIARSFGDYPLALYRYLDAPIVGLFGLTIAHERIVAALAGSLMIVTTGWLCFNTLGRRAAYGAILSSAFAPTWIHFSRYGSEAILLPCTLVTGLALIEHARIHRRHWMLWAGALVLAASAYTYHAVKVILPPFMAALLWYQAPLLRELWRERRRHVLGPALLFAASVLPSVIVALTPEGMARGRTVAAWVHSRGLGMVRTMLNNYLGYFDPGLLFVRGGPAVAQSVPGLGLWCFLDLPLLIVAVVAIARRHEPRRFLAFAVFWFLLGPLPGGITFETHNVGRAIGWLPVPQILAGFGLAVVWEWASRQRRRAIAVGTLVSALWLWTGAATTRLVLTRYPAYSARDWQAEISRALLCAKEQRGARQIVVSPQFQAAEVFARFHYSDLPPLPDGRPAWVFGRRSTVPPGELLVTPAEDHRPSGRVLCEIKLGSAQEPRAYVIAGELVVVPELHIKNPLRVPSARTSSRAN